MLFTPTGTRRGQDSALGRTYKLQNVPCSTRIRRIRPRTVSQFKEGNMNARAIVLTLVLCLVGVAVCFAADANMGTWRLNEAKSKLGAGATKNNTVVYEAAGNDVKVTIDGTDKDGKPT